MGNLDVVSQNPELRTKEYHTWKYTGASSDICFCLADCADTSCHRNKESEFCKKSMEQSPVSMGDLSWSCDDYRSGKQ